LLARTRNASSVQYRPTVRNRKPRMSAMPANVSSGLNSARKPATRNSAANR
jgi:hypothetical protein